MNTELPCKTCILVPKCFNRELSVDIINKCELIYSYIMEASNTRICGHKVLLFSNSKYNNYITFMNDVKKGLK